MMWRISPVWERFLATAALFTAFVVMASVFRPGDSSASNNKPFINTSDGTSKSPTDTSADTSDKNSEASADTNSELAKLGTLHARNHRVEVFATPFGPRYTIYDREGNLLGELLNTDEVQNEFPDANLIDLLSGFDEGQYIMQVEDTSIPR